MATNQETVIKVTDHAILRYLERSSGLDFQQTKQRILTPRLVAAIQKLGNGEIPLSDGSNMIAVVKNNTVITIKEYKPKTKKLVKRTKYPTSDE